MADQNTPEAQKPVTAPAVAPEAKITLDTKDKLTHFKELLKINNEVDPKKQKEIEEIKNKFNAEKDKILTISQKSLDALMVDINDPNETLDKKLEVKDGELVFETKTDAEPAKPEIPSAIPEESIDLLRDTGRLPLAQAPESYQKLIKDYDNNNG